MSDNLSNLFPASRDTADSISAPASAEHPKTQAAARHAAAPLPPESVLITTRQFAKAVAVTPITIHRYAAAGLIPFVKLGDGSARSPRRYRLSDVLAFIESRLSVATK
jgi:hypothetical protein